MAKEMGEFEERPRVKEATPIPLKRRRPTGWIVATILFAIIATAGISFIVIDKMAAKADNCIKGDVAVGQNNKNNNTEEAVTTGFINHAEFGDIYVTKSGDVYISPVDQVIGEGISKKYVRKQDFDLTKTPGKYDTYTLTEDDITGLSKGLSDMVEEGHEETFNGYKLDIEGVVSVFGPLRFGQAWNGYNYAFVKKDGSFDWLHITPGYKDDETSMKATALLTKNVNGYENVASVTSAARNNGTDVMVVLKNGTQEWIGIEQLSKLEGF